MTSQKRRAIDSRLPEYVTWNWRVVSSRAAGSALESWTRMSRSVAPTRGGLRIRTPVVADATRARGENGQRKCRRPAVIMTWPRVLPGAIRGRSSRAALAATRPAGIECPFRQSSQICSSSADLSSFRHSGSMSGGPFPRGFSAELPCRRTDWCPRGVRLNDPGVNVTWHNGATGGFFPACWLSTATCCSGNCSGQHLRLRSVAIRRT